MKSYSTTYAATFTLLVITLLNALNIDVAESEIANLIEALVTLFAALWVLKERYFKGGVNVFGVRQ